jgi:hypothetical protein
MRRMILVLVVAAMLVAMVATPASAQNLATLNLSASTVGSVESPNGTVKGFDAGVSIDAGL